MANACVERTHVDWDGFCAGSFIFKWMDPFELQNPRDETAERNTYSGLSSLNRFAQNMKDMCTDVNLNIRDQIMKKQGPTEIHVLGAG